MEDLQEKLAIMYQEGFDAGVKAGLQLAIKALQGVADSEGLQRLTQEQKQ